MNEEQYVMAIDEGTTSARAMIFPWQTMTAPTGISPSSDARVASSRALRMYDSCCSMMQRYNIFVGLQSFEFDCKRFIGKIFCHEKFYV